MMEINGEQDGEKIKNQCHLWHTFLGIIMKRTFIHIVLFFTLVPHLYKLAKIYIKIILYE